MIYQGDADCHYFHIELADEAFAHRIARNHLESCMACEPEDIRWTTRGDGD